MDEKETKDWHAFSLATEAMRDIDAFVSAPKKDYSFLTDARDKLGEALRRDPDFLRAGFYRAIVEDMLGHPKEASEQLEALLSKNPSFKDEVEYNLGVAYYHSYYLPEMSKAIETFSRVKSRARDASLRLLSQAGLARAYSMMVLHSSKPGAQADPENFFKQAQQESQEVLGRLGTAGLDKRVQDDIQWRVLNGRGVAFMFHSDGVPDLAMRETELSRALTDFTAANATSPDNWEIVCNLGSTEMRLGYLEAQRTNRESATKHYQRAQRYLDDVITRIYPQYGFALYELGRLARIQRDWPQAQYYFEEAGKVPSAERNVSDATLSRESARNNRHDSTFP